VTCLPTVDGDESSVHGCSVDAVAIGQHVARNFSFRSCLGPWKSNLAIRSGPTLEGESSWAWGKRQALVQVGRGRVPPEDVRGTVERPYKVEVVASQRARAYELAAAGRRPSRRGEKMVMAGQQLDGGLVERRTRRRGYIGGLVEMPSAVRATAVQRP
jgi:hypothetical protein